MWNKKTTKGLTLLETIFAVILITLGIGGTYMIISQTQMVVSFTINRFIATYLVQEGMEIVRNIRDSTWFTSNEFLTDSLSETNFYADYRATSSQSLNSCSCSGRDDDYDDNNFPFLCFDTINGYYYDSNCSETIFKRRISIVSTSSEDFTFAVTVFWRERGTLHKIEAQQRLHNWYQVIPRATGETEGTGSP